MSDSYRHRLEGWAVNRPTQARLLFIISEAARLCIAFLFGASLLFKLDINEILILIIAVSSVFFGIMNNTVGRRYFKAYRMRAVALLISSYSMAFLAGNLFNTSNSSQTTYFGQQIIANDYTEVPQHGLLKKAMEEKRKSLPVIATKIKNKEVPKLSGKTKLIFLGGFLLSVVLTYLSLVLSCSLSCNGYILLAVLAFIMAMGFFSAGIYFLVKIFSKNSRRLKELNKYEKKKEKKLFLFIWAGLAGIFLLMLLIISGR
jgi:hypothetical protein